MEVLRRGGREDDLYVHIPTDVCGFEVIIRELFPRVNRIMLLASAKESQLVTCAPAAKRSALAQHHQGREGEVGQSRFVSATWLW